MKKRPTSSYLDLIKQTSEFPSREFHVEDGYLYFNQIPLMEVISREAPPFRLTYIPKIGQNITTITRLFEEAMQKASYQGGYTYCYCTKASHFKFVLKEVVRFNSEIETSSAYDLDLVRKLHNSGDITKKLYILCSGFKVKDYLEKVVGLIEDGYENCIPILDNEQELEFYESRIQRPYNIGLRVATREEPNFEFYTSRLGIRYESIVEFTKSRIRESRSRLVMIHFFINTGIRDTAYYWSELNKFLELYCELSKIVPELKSINIGGGLPIKNGLNFSYDYGYMVEQIVHTIKAICSKRGVPVPNIFTEFGKYTVGESEAIIYSVVGQKKQNDTELWYMMDGSLITQIPDVWGLNEKFILLPVNHWGQEYHRVKIGGLTCDSKDYYDSESHIGEVFLPKIPAGQPLYFGFFHTGAYQTSLAGIGGVQHCLIPTLKHLLVEVGEDGKLDLQTIAAEQSSDEMLKPLGY